MRFLVRTIAIVGMIPLLACSSGGVSKNIEEQGKARQEFELIRQAYYDTADIPATREALADLSDEYLSYTPEEVFSLLERMDQVQSLDLALSSYARPFSDDECEGELLRLRRDLRRAGGLTTTSRGAEKVKLSRSQRQLQDMEARLQACVAREAQSMGEEDRLLLTSSDPAVLRPIVDRKDAELAASGSLTEIMPYLRRSTSMRHSQALIDRTDRLLLSSADRDLIAAYLFHYSDYRHDDALVLHLDRLFLESEDWVAVESYLRQFHASPHAGELESGLLAYYESEYETGALLFDQERIAEAAGHLANVAPRSPQYGAARSLLAEAERQGYHRWDQPEVWSQPSYGSW